MDVVGNTRVLDDGVKHIPKGVVISSSSRSKGAILALKSFMLLDRSFCEPPKLFARDGQIDEIIR